jgi:CBS domain-containing protein
MFSVYGVSGRLFNGTMEELRQVGGVAGVARSRAVESVGQDEHHRPFPQGAAPAPKGEETHHPGLAAYAQSGRPSLPRHALSRTDELMSRSVVTIPDRSTVLQGWQLLAHRGVGQAPVVDASGVLVGLLSRADLLRPERLPTPEVNALVWRALLAQSVRDIMWTPVPAVAPDTDIRRVARLLLDTGLPGLPVVDAAGQVAGFLSRSDILRAVVADPPLDLWG